MYNSCCNTSNQYHNHVTSNPKLTKSKTKYTSEIENELLIFNFISKPNCQNVKIQRVFTPQLKICVRTIPLVVTRITIWLNIVANQWRHNHRTTTGHRHLPIQAGKKQTTVVFV
ncbi:hypothetical protein HanPSC8_Chr11g0465771 [Helianthus annuus]|nr:hypothetical protein HanPSC8_Chr11g0465771 [Helianthus annuus]